MTCIMSVDVQCIHLTCAHIIMCQAISRCRKTGDVCILSIVAYIRSYKYHQNNDGDMQVGLRLVI